MTAVKHDIDMENENGGAEQQVEQENEKVLTVSRNPPDDFSSATYAFVGEDHTLGNLIRN